MGIPISDLPIELRRQLGLDKTLTPSKYHNQRTEVDGITFDSKREARFYQRLKEQRLGGLVLFWLRQVPFHLPGGVKYLVDFEVFMADGAVRFIDVKGVRTKEYRLKKRLVESLYPVMIEEA